MTDVLHGIQSGTKTVLMFNGMALPCYITRVEFQDEIGGLRRIVIEYVISGLATPFPAPVQEFVDSLERGARRITFDDVE